MSKFIRTKDTIFEVVEETDIVYRVKAKRNPNNIYAKSKCQTIVLKEANKLKDLCDTFVFYFKSNSCLLVDNYERALEILKANYEDKGDFVFRGAIWTSKGLIYVAKMNDKGKLELL